jgi:hypothetical protein
MRTVADPDVVKSLTSRLGHLQPDTPRRWGTLTAHEMLCHLGDAAEFVLLIRPRRVPIHPRGRALVRLVGLWTPLPWPRGIKTNPMHDPKAEGTRPSDFSRDRSRVVGGIDGIARATGNLEPVHGIFGEMSVRDWQRWMYRHTHHHLRQFGL